MRIKFLADPFWYAYKETSPGNWEKMYETHAYTKWGAKRNLKKLLRENLKKTNAKIYRIEDFI